MFVDKKHLVSIFERESITKGQYLVRAENQIIQADTVHSFDLNQRKIIARTFFENLEKSGPLGAYKYSKDVLINGIKLHE
jgi:hypothetical protein